MPEAPPTTTHCTTSKHVIFLKSALSTISQSKDRLRASSPLIGSFTCYSWTSKKKAQERRWKTTPKWFLVQKPQIFPHIVINTWTLNKYGTFKRQTNSFSNTRHSFYTLLHWDPDGVKHIITLLIYVEKKVFTRKKNQTKKKSAQLQRKTCSSCDSSFQQDATVRGKRRRSESSCIFNQTIKACSVEMSCFHRGSCSKWFLLPGTPPQIKGHNSYSPFKSLCSAFCFYGHVQEFCWIFMYSRHINYILACFENHRPFCPFLTNIMQMNSQRKIPWTQNS